MLSVVQLLCDLSEAPDTPFIADTIEPGLRGELSALQRLGAVRDGPRPDTITCRACDSDHFAAVDFDGRTQRYFPVFMPGGWGCLGQWRRSCDAPLLTRNGLLDWLTSTLEISMSRSRRGLINRKVWHLGDATCGGTLMTVIFARRVISQSELDGLASVLRPIHRAEKGVVITTSPRVARQVRLPGGYEFLDLSEIARSEGDRLMLDASTNSRIAWIKGMEPTTAKGAPARRGEGHRPQQWSRAYSTSVVAEERFSRTIRQKRKPFWPNGRSTRRARSRQNISTVRRHVKITIGANGPS